MNIPDIVKQHVLIHKGRMPETEQEVDAYLDLINHAKGYEKSLLLSSKFSKGFMKKFGFKAPDEVKEEGKQLFSY